MSRRYQHPTPFPSKSGKWWMGSYYEYVPHRQQRQVKLCPRWENGRVVPKRLAQRILDSIVEPINRSAGACVEAKPDISFDAFVKIYERDYLPMSSRSSQSTVKGSLSE